MKKTKKIISVMLAVMMMSAAMVMPAFDVAAEVVGEKYIAGPATFDGFTPILGGSIGSVDLPDSYMFTNYVNGMSQARVFNTGSTSGATDTEKAELVTTSGPQGDADTAIEVITKKQLSESFPAMYFELPNKVSADRIIVSMDTKINGVGNAVQLEKMFGADYIYFKLFNENGRLYGDKVSYAIDEWKRLDFDLDYCAKSYKMYYDGELAFSGDWADATKIQAIKFEFQQLSDNQLKFAVDNIKIYEPVEMNISVPQNNDVVEYYVNTKSFVEEASAVVPYGFSKLEFSLNGKVFKTMTEFNESNIYNANLSEADNVIIGAKNTLSVTAEYDGVEQTRTSSFYVQPIVETKDVITEADFKDISKPFDTSLGSAEFTDRYFLQKYYSNSAMYNVMVGTGENQSLAVLDIVEGADGGEDKAIRITTNGKSDDYPYIYHALSKSVESAERVVFEMDTKINSTTDQITFSDLIFNYELPLFQQDGKIFGGNVSYVPNEWKKLKIDLNYKKGKFCIYYDGQLAFERDASDINQQPQVIKMFLKQIGDSTLSFSMDNFKIYKLTQTRLPYIEKISSRLENGRLISDTVVIPAKEIVLTMSDELADTTSETIDITYTNASGTLDSAVNGDITINGKAVTIPVEQLQEGTEYNVVIGGTDISLSFVPHKPQNKIETAGNTVSYSIFSYTEKTAVQIIAGYGDNGMLLNVDIKPISLVPGQYEDKMTIEGSYAKVKGMVWSSIQELVPLIPVSK